MSKCNIICTLSPDALSLLQLVRVEGSNIDFEEIGHVNGFAVKESKVHRASPTTRTINGVKFQKWSKFGLKMNRDTVLALGTLPNKYDKDSNLAKAYTAIAMVVKTTPAHKDLATTTHGAASVALKPLFTEKSPTYVPGIISELYRLGALRVVL